MQFQGDANGTSAMANLSELFHTKKNSHQTLPLGSREKKQTNHQLMSILSDPVEVEQVAFLQAH